MHDVGNTRAQAYIDFFFSLALLSHKDSVLKKKKFLTLATRDDPSSIFRLSYQEPCYF